MSPNRSPLLLLDLPRIPLYRIAQYLSAKELSTLSLVCRTLYDLCTDELLWEDHCLNDWPYFFWDGKCERVALEIRDYRS
ncbi:hypothetical protein HK102_006349, partial [Quaeritorhiza haematococci]